MNCLADSELIQLVDGSLSGEVAGRLEAHIDRCERCFGTVAALLRGHSALPGRRPPAPLPTVKSASLDEESHDEEPHLIGRRYLVMSVIGQGGMGQVYRAHDRLTGQTVALKRVFGRAAGSQLANTTALSGSGDTATYAGCLEQEFRILATLRHPNIISVLDYGFDEQLKPFFTMELLAGARPLLPFALSLPETTRIELLIQLLHALGYLHRRGVLHRERGRGRAVGRRGSAISTMLAARGSGAEIVAAGSQPSMASVPRTARRVRRS